MKKPTKADLIEENEELIENSKILNKNITDLSIALCKLQERLKRKDDRIGDLEEALDDKGTTVFYESASKEDHNITDTSKELKNPFIP